MEGFVLWMQANWGWVLSFVTVFTGIFTYLFRNLRALKLGVQAVLRNSMVNDWNKYSEKGYAPIYAKQSFENCWVQYETLGVNGVMSEIHRKFMDLPDRPQH